MVLFGVANSLIRSVITIFVSIYILLGRTSILGYLSKMNEALFKEKTSNAVSHYFTRGNEIFFTFVSSQVIDAIIMGSMVGVVSWIMGVQYGVLFAIMAGLFNMIPVLGSIVATAIMAFITLFTGGFALAFWFLIVVIILQQIDANIINPRLVGRMLKMSPIFIIFAVIVFGEYFGILGMFLAVPTIAIIKEIVNDYVEHRLALKEK